MPIPGLFGSDMRADREDELRTKLLIDGTFAAALSAFMVAETALGTTVIISRRLNAYAPLLWPGIDKRQLLHGPGGLNHWSLAGGHVFFHTFEENLLASMA